MLSAAPDTRQVDLLVIGAGPAGMAAALSAHQAGLQVLVLDENARPGGQIYRDVAQSPLPDPALLGPDYLRGRTLVAQFEASGIACWDQTLVWQITPDKQVSFTHKGALAGSGQIQARRIIIANGAYERPFPVPGWQLPGVMGVGAAQILLKSAALLPREPVVLAGCGPLLYLFAWQLIQFGQPVKAILDTAPADGLRQALRYLPAALRAPSPLLKGLRLLWAIRRSGTRHIKGVTALELLGQQQLEAVRYQAVGRSATLATSLVLLHQGVVPNVQLTRSLGCEHVWSEAQLCWHPRLDGWGETSRPGIFVAGDGGGIAGALAAQAAGALTGWQVAQQLGVMDAPGRDALAAQAHKELKRQRAVRPFLDALYRPGDPFRRPPDHAMVCRCEEVSAGEIRQMAQLGCAGPNQTKTFSRCGMGPCQGRFCGLTVAELLAQQHQQPVADIGYYRIRAPIKPVTIGDLAVSYVPDPNLPPPQEY